MIYLVLVQCLTIWYTMDLRLEVEVCEYIRGKYKKRSWKLLVLALKWSLCPNLVNINCVQVFAKCTFPPFLDLSGLNECSEKFGYVLEALDMGAHPHGKYSEMSK